MAITALMLMGATVAATNVNAATPSTGKLQLQITYTINGNPAYVANDSETTTVSYANGIQVSSGTGPSPVFNLNYGTYVLTQSPMVVSVPGYGKSIANKTTETVSVNSASKILDVNVSISVTHKVQLSVQGLPLGESANAYFLTSYRFQFLGPLTVQSNMTYNVSLPSGSMLAYVKYAGATYTFSKSLSAASTSLTLSLSSTTGVFGFVQAADGSQISGVTAVILNDATGHYTVSRFSGNSFTLYPETWTGKTLILSSNGYAPYINSSVSAGQLKNVVLKRESSTINYNYNLSANLHTLNLTISYSLGPGTTVPQLPNATVNSLYEQYTLDGFTSSSLTPFFKALVLNYTNDTIEVAGTSYELSSAGPSVTFSSMPSSMTGYLNATVTATYTNATISASKLASGYQVKIFAMGKSYSPGTLNTNYTFAYNNSNLALSSSSVKVSSHVSPILIPGQTSSGWVYLTFSPVKEPKFYNTQIKLYWSGLKSQNYLLNTSAHPAFVVPENVPVYFNMSDAFYNPVTGSYNYLPPTSFSWTVNNVAAGTGYNFSHAFSALNNTVQVTGTSNTGNTTSTFFTVYAYNGTPTVKYSVSYNGKIMYNGNATSSPIPISVPQSALVTFSLYNSTIPIPGTNNMSIPLLYNWTFASSSYASPNVTHIFQKPSIAVANQEGNVTVSGITGGSKSFTFKVNVNDTTPPTPKIQLFDSSGKSISNPVAGKVLNFSASKTTDPYYSDASAFKYRWTFHYPNGTAISNTSGVFKVVYNNLNSSSVGVRFTTLNTVVAELAVTNPSNVTGYLNRTLTVLVSSPRLVVNDVYIPGSLQQGKTSTVYVNVSNKGTEDATSFTISVLINGVVKATQPYNTPLNKSQYRNMSFTWKPDTSGSISVQFIANNSSEPAFFANLGGKTTSVSIAAPGYKTPLIAAGIVAVIVVVGVIYWRLSSGGLRRGGGSTKSKEPQKSKVSLPSDQKKLEKKK